MKKKVLAAEFFDRPTLTVARELIGKYLVRKVGGKASPVGRTRPREIALMIEETEGYDGPKDLACHARSGKTKRNWPMFEKAGTIYVYFTYGMHWMLNLVTGEKEYPAAVLIRGAGGVVGPARLTTYLKIDKKLNALTLSKKSGLWVEDRGVIINPRQIKRTPRIGVNYAGSYALKPWRFVLVVEK